MRVKFYERSGRSDARYSELSDHSQRLAALVEQRPSSSEDSVLSCLDDLLGAIYSLFHSSRRDYDHRPQELPKEYFKTVLDRANDMAKGCVRLDGKWAAGYYLNSALFRIDSVQHRVLEIVAGTEEAKFEKLLNCASAWFKKSQGHSWTSEYLEKVSAEVIRLKHRRGGLESGRKAELDDSVKAVAELLTLFEAFQKSGQKPVCDLTRGQREKKKCVCHNA